MTPASSQVSLARRLLSGGAWSLGGRIAWLPLGLALSMVLARALSPADLGAYFLAASVIVFGRLLGSMGLANACTRRLAEHRARGEFHAAVQTTRRGLVLSATAGVFLALLYWLGGAAPLSAWFSEPGLVTVTPWVAVLLVVESITFVVAGAFRGYGDIRYATLFNGLVARSLLLVFVLALFLTRGVQLESVFAILAMNATLSLAMAPLLLVRKVRHDVGPTTTAVDAGPVRGLITIALPMMVVSFVGGLSSQFDLWLVGATHSGSDLAVYGTASRLALLVAIPLQSVAATLPPTIARLNAEGRRVDLERVLRSSSTLAALPAVTGVAIAVFFGRVILRWLYGEAYAAGSPVLIALAFGWLGSTLAGTCGVALSMTGHERLVLWTTLLTMTLTCAVGFASIGSFGLVGLACVVALGTTLHAFLLLILVRRRLGLWAHATLRPAGWTLADLRAAARRGFMR